MAFAGALIVGMSANALGRYKNVKIMPSHKHEVIPNWNEAHEKYNTVVERVGRNPVSLFPTERYKSLPYEGLGVDHDDFVKQNNGGQK
jgi:hypothetical protein